MPKKSSRTLFLVILSLMFSAILMATNSLTSAQPQAEEGQTEGAIPTSSIEYNEAEQNDSGDAKPWVEGAVAGDEPTFISPPALDRTEFGYRFQDSADAPTVVLWYGPNQTFGQQGDPQKWINILGNVTKTNLASITYTLNGGAPITLRTGPDTRRLAGSGDFNVEIDYTDLNPGANQVVITARNASNETTQVNVVVNYMGGGITWTTPRTLTYEWDSVDKVGDLAQVVDGNWTIDGGSLRPLDIDYDRLVAFGDMGWKDYTVTVPITILGIDPDGYNFPSNGPGIGILMRWLGHIEDEQGLTQPIEGWRRLGTLAWYNWRRTRVNDEFVYTEGLQAYRYLGRPNQVLTAAKKLNENTIYIFKASVQSSEVAGQPSNYKFKVWNASNSEPAAWDMEFSGIAGEPANGSFMLVAHHVDARIGDVTVQLAGTQPKPVLNVSTKGTGSGNVQLSPSAPNNVYRFGEDVELRAQPAAGSTFGGWQGSLTGTTNPAYLEMFTDQNVTALFTDPSVQTPVSDDFSACTLPDMWTFTDPLGGATLTMTGSQVEITIPSGQSHDLWTNNKNAPRITQEIQNTDFEFVTKFDTPLTTRFQLQGVLVEQDSVNFLRYNFQHDGAGYRIVAYTISNNVETLRANSAITISPPMYLKTSRVDDTWTLSYSANGTSWTQAAQFNHVMTPSSAGIFVGNAGQNPSTTTRVDYFFNAESPIIPQDTNRILTLTTSGGGTGSVQKSPDKSRYNCNEVVTLTAIPGDNSRFVFWDGDLSGNDNPETIVMDDSKQVEAIFDSASSYSVTVNINGSGVVNKDPEKSTYELGETVTLTAVAANGQQFDGWSGDLSGNTNPVTITVNGDTNITATFSQLMYTLQLSKQGEGAVSVNPTGTMFIPGTQITLTANPADGYTFSKWLGDITGNSNPTTLVMNSNKTVTAVFIEEASGGLLFLPVTFK